MAEHGMDGCGRGRGLRFEAHAGRHGGHGGRRLAACVVAALLASLLVSSSASAVEQSAARKVGRGFANVTLGVLAIPGEMVQRSRKSGPGLGVTLGAAIGVGKFVAHEVVGVWEILTCPFEWPPGFRPILDPEFPWQYFTGESRYGKTEDDW